MTVASQLKQTLASLKGAEAMIRQYALHHPDQATKEAFSESETVIARITMDLDQRIQQIEFEEPQFKGY